MGDRRSKSTGAEVRPRVGQTGRYLDHGDGTVTDAETGRQWMRCSLGQTWQGGDCVGEARKYTWDTAMAVARELNQLGGYAGYCDWRVPTIEELNSLVYCSGGKPGVFPFVGKRGSGGCEGTHQKPTIDWEAFPNTPPFHFWSGSPSANYANRAWGVVFGYGSAGNVPRSYGSRVRLVRGGQ